LFSGGIFAFNDEQCSEFSKEICPKLIVGIMLKTINTLKICFILNDFVKKNIIILNAPNFDPILY
jgi:hypothetical protein